MLPQEWERGFGNGCAIPLKWLLGLLKHNPVVTDSKADKVGAVVNARNTPHSHV